MVVKPVRRTAPLCIYIYIYPRSEKVVFYHYRPTVGMLLLASYSTVNLVVDRAAEIYPGIATEPVGGTGLKATGLEASRS